MSDKAPTPSPVRARERTRLCLADGVELAADIYRPEGAGRLPVLLMRQPYGRRIASTVVHAHPAWFSARGYIVVVQDVRGCGESTGRFHALADETEDGAATLAWAAELAGSTGQVATYGFSYQGITQFLAMAGARRAGTKRPDAIAPAMAAWMVRDDWVFEGGALQLTGQVGWACQMAAEQARRAGDARAFDALARAGRGAPWTGPDPARPAALVEHAQYSHWAEWLADKRDTWDRIAPAAVLRDDPLDVPGLHVGGFLDVMLEGTLASYRAFETARAAPQRLVVGPWLHIPWGRQIGTLDLGADAVTPIDQQLVSFFDFHLKGIGAPGPRVRLFDMGAKHWMDFESLPAFEPKSLFLTSNGLAATTSTDGGLAAEPRGHESDFLVHDPWRPAPMIGGHVGLPPGFQDRSGHDDRSDVAVYTSHPLEHACVLAGRVAAEIYVDCDCPSHDLHCTLSVVGWNRGAITLTAGHLRIFSDDPPGPRFVSMRATCCTLPVRAQLRLSIQAAAWPAFEVNPGTGVRPEQSRPVDAVVTTLAIHHNAQRPSRLLLPILP
jgi:uncharacterized protein